MFNKRERILSLLNIRQVVDYYCPHLKFNRNLRCPCPIHGGEKPNFQIYPKTGSYYCFTCQSGGDLINFTAALFGLSYKEAMEKLNLDFGLNLDGNLTFADYLLLKQKKQKRARDLGRRKVYLAKLNPLIDQKYSLMDQYIRLQGYKTAYCPQNLDDFENVSHLYILACRQLPLIEAEINAVEDKISLLKQQYKLNGG